MHSEVVQKEFQGGLFQLGWTGGLLSVAIAGFCIWQGAMVRDGHKYMDPELFADPPVRVQATAISGCTGTGLGAESVNRSRESDFYLVAGRNLAEGTVLRPRDLKVVRMPGLHGYEEAFFSPQAVIGMSVSHAVPEGQPVLPYHVENSLNRRRYSETDR